MSTPSTEPQLGDTPIQYDFGPHVEPIARAGHDAYRQGRNERSWEELTGRERHRWMMAAEDVFSTTGVVDAKRIRAVYLTGYAVEPWENLKLDFQRRWWAIRDAMVLARDRWNGTREATRERLVARRQKRNRHAPA